MANFVVGEGVPGKFRGGGRGPRFRGDDRIGYRVEGRDERFGGDDRERKRKKNPGLGNPGFFYEILIEELTLDPHVVE